MTVIPLRTNLSTGPRIVGHIDIGPDHTAPIVQDSPCPVCSRRIVEGDRITYLGAGWGHASCVSEELTTANARSAWLILGSQLARRPSHFNARETRVIVDNLLRLAGEFEPETWEPGDDPT